MTPTSTPARSLLGRTFGSLLLLAALGGAGFWLVNFKRAARAESAAAAASQPEMVSIVNAVPARASEHVRASTSIGTVRALRSVSLRNELPGSVRDVHLESGAVVEEGALLVALDVTVEEAELAAAEARVRLSETLLGRVKRAAESQGASEADVDRAKAEFDVANADVLRIRALIDRKVVRAPFRARVGLSDVHVGQYLEAGTLLTSLQGVDEAVHVDFQVAQHIASALSVGEHVEVFVATEGPGVQAEIVALDAQIDPRTRNAMLRARLEGPLHPAPGGSVRVRVPVGDPVSVTVVPVSALRKSPAGEHVFVLVKDEQGALRARLRNVESGPMLGDEVVIHAGLEVGELVAASGSFKLMEGMLVALSEPQPVSEGATATPTDAPAGGQ
jgi:membrane fusion protein (multidrug efflux system)